MAESIREGRGKGGAITESSGAVEGREGQCQPQEGYNSRGEARCRSSAGGALTF